MTADDFAAAVRTALPKVQRNLSAAAVGALRSEYIATIAPMAAKLAEAARHELALSKQVNRVYGINAADEELIWTTAPPRMPVPPPGATEHRGKEADGKGQRTETTGRSW